MQERHDTPAAALWCAAYAGNLAVVERLILEAVDVNVWDEHGRTALTFAAEAGHLDIVRRLASAGAWVDPHDEGSVFMTPLMSAAAGGRVEIVEYLLDQGADPTRHGGHPASRGRPLATIQGSIINWSRLAMEIPEFAEITYQVLRDTPLEVFIPTLCLPARSQIHALADVPAAEENNLREISLKWAEETAGQNEEFLVAFRDGAGYFRIIRRAEGELHEALYPAKKRS